WQVGAAEPAIKAQGDYGDPAEPGQQRGIGEIERADRRLPSFGLETQDFTRKFALGGRRVGVAKLAAGDIRIDPGKHEAKMAVGIVQFGRACVDRAPTRCVEKCNAGYGGNGSGNEPEKHGPWTLDAGTRQ